MFAVQQRFFEETVTCTRERFYEVVRSKEVAETIDACRQLLAAGDRKGYDTKKRSLPAFIFMATMMPNRGKDGQRPEGAWRLQSAVRLNGLVMLDFDHLQQTVGKTPLEVFNEIPSHWFDDTSCRQAILLVHRTPSGDGLRLVCMADKGRGTLADNQQSIATALGLSCDKSVKNADRTSFAVKEGDIFYINDKIFTYEDAEYDKMYGDLYRRNGSRGSNGSSAADRDTGVQAATMAAHAADQPAGHPLGQDGQPLVPAEVGDAVGTVAQPPSEAVAGGAYHGIPFQTIVDRWLELYGVPEQGDRHTSALRLACDLRYICDNDPRRLVGVLRLAPFVRDIIGERGEEEIAAVAKDACAYRYSMTRPQRVRALLEGLGGEWKVESGEWKENTDADHSNLPSPPGEGPGEGPYETFWRRLEPLLTAPYEACCDGVEPYNRLGAVFAAGTMYCTLMTRCWYQHFDGERQRLNPQAYIIGMPASGKSFANRLDDQIMNVMRSADRMGREAEAEYKRQQKERSTSSKAQKGEALKRPEMMIRYLPSRTSNAVFYRRLQNAHEEVDGEDMALHLYTFDSELDANTTAQSGGSWIGKHDVELKAFHNERTGVDYANGDSVNDILPVYFNQVETGTPISLQKKINLRNINDGLCSRIAVFPMVSSAYRMIARGNTARNNEKFCEMRQWGFRFDAMKGELKIGRLVEHVYQLCEQSAFEAEASGDLVLDYLRKRAVFYATWFTIPRIYARQWEAYQQTGEVEVDDEDLKFATLIYDAVIYWQDHFFGAMLQESWENAANEYKPRRRRQSKNDAAFEQLPKEFGTEDAEKMLGLSKMAVAAQLHRWVDCGRLERIGHGRYRKEVRS